VPRIGRTTVLVSDQDAAIDFYTRALGFRVLFDATLETGFRSVHVGPGAVGDPGLWLVASSSDRVGAQTGGESLLVLYSEDLDADLARLADVGVQPHVGPAGAPGGRYAHVRDPWGTELVLVDAPPPGL